MKTLKHAFQMVWRNRRSYSLLSVTVVLTFAFLLGYLLYTDASLYNKHKKILSYDKKVAIFCGDGTGDSRMDQVMERAQAKGTTYHYKALWHSAMIERRLPLDQEKSDYEYFQYTPQCVFIPSHVWGLYVIESGDVQPLPVQWLDGQERDNVYLGSHQMLMERHLYELLELDKIETPIYELILGDRFCKSETELNENRTVCIRMEVVGLVETVSEQNMQQNITLGYNKNPTFVLPMSLLGELPDEIQEMWVEGYQWHDVYYTDVPEVACGAADGMDISYSSVYRMHNQATEAIRNANSTKAIIAAALFVILGISLYSCFSNALNDRKFEIGVKRAIGASGGSIIRQFLMESLIVMGADILVSVSLVLNLAAIFKFLTTRIPALAEKFHPWIIYLSPYSMGMFALCALGLTVGFSLIFAYKSTQVQIVDYLKAE